MHSVEELGRDRPLQPVAAAVEHAERRDDNRRYDVERKAECALEVRLDAHRPGRHDEGHVTGIEGRGGRRGVGDDRRRGRVDGRVEIRDRGGRAEVGPLDELEIRAERVRDRRVREQDQLAPRADEHSCSRLPPPAQGRGDGERRRFRAVANGRVCVATAPVEEPATTTVLWTVSIAPT